MRNKVKIHVCTKTTYWLWNAQVDVTENHVNASSAPKIGRRVIGTPGPSSHAAAAGRGPHRRQSSSSLTSSSSLSSTGSRRSAISHSSNLSYSQDDADSTGKSEDPAATNLEIHEVKVVFLKVSVITRLSLLALKRFRFFSLLNSVKCWNRNRSDYLSVA